MVEENEVIEGSLVVFGGDATIAGEVEKDVVVFGGDVELKPTAVIYGDLVFFGGKVTREEGAKILGSEVTNISRLRNLKIERAPWVPFTVTGRSWLGNFLSLLGSLALVLIIVALLPKHTQVAAEAIGKNPWGTLGVGILVALALFPGVILLVITLIGILLIPLWVLLYIVSGLFAYAIGSLFLGQKVAEAGKLSLAPIWTVLIGALIINLLQFIPFVGGLVILVVITFGFGAIVKTKYGTGKSWFAKREATSEAKG